jgi:hypothetical protein
MIRAVIKNGAIQPVEAMPSDWSDGHEVVVEDAEVCRRPEDIDRWYKELEAMAATIDPEDDQRLHDAVSEVRREAKARAQREMGLA